MIPSIDVRHTLDRLEANLGMLAKERLQAAVRAMNRTMTTVRKEAATDLRKEYPGVKIALLKARMKLKRASQQIPTAAVVFSGKRFALYGNFGMRAFGKWGVGFGKLPWRIETISGETVPPEMLARAFRNRRSGGRATVFSRHTKVRTSQEVLVAPGIARALTEKHIGNSLTRVARKRFAIVFLQEMNFRLSKR